MVLNNSIQQALNGQIADEFYAAYLYLSMSSWFTRQSLPGFAHWMRMQREEEIGHGMKILEFIHDRQGRVELQSLPKPPADFDSPLDVFRQAHEHEREVTGRIHELYEMAVKEKDYPTQTLLQWFIVEQVEEEATAQQIVDQLERVAESGTGILMLDREMGQRTTAA